MSDTTPIESEALARYLAGASDAPERERVERWSAAAPAHAAELAALRRIWDSAGQARPMSEPDVDVAWRRVNDRIEGAGGGGRVVPFNVKRWLAAAAVIAGVVFATRLLFAQATVQLAATGAYVRSTLADSSRVVLAPGSHLTARLGDERRITLHGEAYFEVARDTEHPFTVAAADVDVTVLGTAFEVTAYDSSAVVQVRVREGRVQVVAERDTVVLHAGERARYDRAKHELERGANGPLEHWGDRLLQFDQAPLELVREQLQQRFHVELELANAAIGQCRLTATFEDEPVDTVLQVIADTFGLRVVHTGPGRYRFEGDGC